MSHDLIAVRRDSLRGPHREVMLEDRSQLSFTLIGRDGCRDLVRLVLAHAIGHDADGGERWLVQTKGDTDWLDDAVATRPAPCAGVDRRCGKAPRSCWSRRTVRGEPTPGRPERG